MNWLPGRPRIFCRWTPVMPRASQIPCLWAPVMPRVSLRSCFSRNWAATPTISYPSPSSSISLRWPWHPFRSHSNPGDLYESGVRRQVGSDIGDEAVPAWSLDVTHWITAAEKRTSWWKRRKKVSYISIMLGKNFEELRGESGRRERRKDKGAERTIAIAAHQAQPRLFPVESHQYGQVPECPKR